MRDRRHRIAEADGAVSAVAPRRISQCVHVRVGVVSARRCCLFAACAVAVRHRDRDSRIGSDRIGSIAATGACGLCRRGLCRRLAATEMCSPGVSPVCSCVLTSEIDLPLFARIEVCRRRLDELGGEAHRGWLMRLAQRGAGVWIGSDRIGSVGGAAWAWAAGRADGRVVTMCSSQTDGWTAGALEQRWTASREQRTNSEKARNKEPRSKREI